MFKVNSIRRRITPYIIVMVWSCCAFAAWGAPGGRPSVVEGEVLIKYRAKSAPTLVKPSVAAVRGLGSGDRLWQFDASANNSPVTTRFGEEMAALARRHRVKIEGIEPLVSSGARVSGKAGARAEQVVSLRERSRHHRVVFSGKADVWAVAEEIATLPGVEYAEPNFIGAAGFVPSDPLYPQQASDLGLVGAEAAWDIQAGANGGVVVAVIDSGIDFNHGDLQAAVDTERSYNFVDDSAVIFDDLGHGTRVAGIIGAGANNAEGIAGLAFGCSLISLDVTDSDGGITAANVVQALGWAEAQGVTIANMSLTFLGYSQMLEEACANAAGSGVLLVASAGNQAQGDQPVYPASFCSVVGVGAVFDDGVSRASYSNFNGEQQDLVELVAPGSTLFSTIPGTLYNGTFGTGTSYAAPVVSGAAGLLAAQNPDQSGGALRAHLAKTASADLIGIFEPLESFGRGRIDAASALGTPMRPEFIVDGFEVFDDPGLDTDNNGNGALENGETAHLFITLLNAGADIGGFQAKLATEDLFLSVLAEDSLSSWSAIENGQRLKNDVPFTVTLSDLSPSHVVEFELSDTEMPGAFDPILFGLGVRDQVVAPQFITEDTTWTADKSYLVETDSFVLAGATLTIEPGTDVRFEADTSLEIRGGLAAVGTENLPVRFSSSTDAPGGGFMPTEVFSGGELPADIAIGDVNLDGDNDVLIVDREANRLIFYLWNGTGFDSPITRQTGLTPVHAVIADANNDTLNDVVVANFDSNNVMLFSWNGAGLDLVRTLSVGLEPGSVAVGDADNDGQNDIICGNRDSNTISLWIWNGSDFSAATPLAVGGTPGAVQIVDGDNDSDLDIFAADVTNGSPKLFKWNGAGHDAAATLFTAPGLDFALIADPDNDHDNDLLMTDQDNLIFLRWNGTAYDTPELLPAGNLPDEIEVADVDNDGDRDVLVTVRSDNELLLFRWNGSALDEPIALPLDFPSGAVVGDISNDGLNDIAATNVFLDSFSILFFDPTLSFFNAYKGLSIRDNATTATLQNCLFKFARVDNLSSATTIVNCTFDRTGAKYALLSEAPVSSITGCTVIANQRGDGIRAGSNSVESSEVRLSAGDGIVAGTIIDCTATGNGGWGLLASASIRHSTAIGNANGMKAPVVEGSRAEFNVSTGIESSVAVSFSEARQNGGAGFAGTSTLESIVAAFNGSGLNVSGTASRAYLAENAGNGAVGGTITDSAVIGHSASGIDEAVEVRNSYVIRNGGNGLNDKSTSVKTVIGNSAILSNGASGVVSAESLNNSWIEGNADYDYLEVRHGSSLQISDAAFNYWGAETTLVMNEHPFGTTFNIETIFDFIDDTNLTHVDYSDHLTTATAAGPNAAASAVLLFATPNPGEPVSIGEQDFLLTFSEDMATTGQLVVTFAANPPFSENIVESAPGWTGPRQWRGIFYFQTDTGDGLHTIRVSGAEAADGFSIPDDTSNRFIVDTSGSPSSNNGIPGNIGNSIIAFSWTENNPLPFSTDQGYYVIRTSLGPGTSVGVRSTDIGIPVRLNSNLLTTPGIVDTGLQPGTIYDYVVKMVGSDGGSRDWIADTYITRTSFSVSPEVNQFGHEGGEATIQVNQDLGFLWSAETNEPWITITSPGDAAGVGPAMLTYEVGPNTGSARSGAIMIIDETHFVEQASGESSQAPRFKLY